jgi:hypothetical protein
MWIPAGACPDCIGAGMTGAPSPRKDSDKQLVPAPERSGNGSGTSDEQAVTPLSRTVTSG